MLTGCQLNMQDATEKPPMKLSGPTEDCFSQSLDSIERYFQGAASIVEVDAAYTCFSSAFDMFAQHGRGAAEAQTFSAKELRLFLEEHLLDGLKISDTLLLEAMQVKRAFLGGSLTHLKKSEIEKLIEILEVMRVETQRLRPHITVLSLDKAAQDVEPGELERVISDFVLTADVFGRLLHETQQPYGLEHLKTMLFELQGFYSGRSSWEGPDWFARQMGLVAAVKAFLIRPDGMTIDPREWRLLFGHAGRIYGLFLRFKYGMQDRDLMRGNGLKQVGLGVQTVSNILKSAIAAKPGGERVDYDLLKDVFVRIDSLELDLPVRGQTIADSLEAILEKALNPIVTDPGAGLLDPRDLMSIRGSRPRQGGLTEANLKRLTDAVLSWVEMQEIWEKLEADADVRYPEYAGKAKPLRLVRELWAGYKATHTEAWSDLKSIFERALPPSTRENGSLAFEKASQITYDHDSFSNLNWKQQIVRTVGYGYVANPEALHMEGITLEQFGEVFKDYRPIATDLGFLDEKDDDIWKTAFTISNTFLFSANADSRLGYHEATDLFVFQFASGLIADRIQDDVGLNCAHQGMNSSGFPLITASCWRERLRTGYQSFFADIPGWLQTVARFSSSAWDKFFDNLEKASRQPTNPKGPLSRGEMNRAVSVHHYMEALYTRWDMNGDGILTVVEADRAFFLFHRVLKEASGFDDDQDVRALFFYLLAYGKPPNPSSISDAFRWLRWKGNPDSWDAQVKADRERIAQIFGELASRF
ncbi:MAG: hypothetical protein RBT63_00335 [Bdellovibrionales bacterium]|nr:hypothetical protein [Bdellovibrionales bacterium]